MKKMILCVIYGLLIGVSYAGEQNGGVGANLVDPNQRPSQTIPELINGTSYDEPNRLRQHSLPEQLEKSKATLSAEPAQKCDHNAKTTNQNHESPNAMPYQCTIITTMEYTAEYYNNTHEENKVRCYVDGWD
jgi:hypothetical protein